MGRIRPAGRLALSDREATITAIPDSGLTGVTAAEAAALAQLLHRLGRDGDGGVAYESLRRRLVVFFRLHDPAQDEALADVVLDRLGRKLAEGTEIEHMPAYALAVARLVAFEARARRARERAAEDEAMRRADIDGESVVSREVLDAALSACLDGLGPATADLLLSYYADRGQTRIRRRALIAERLGLTANALRNRALRLRGALEKCITLRLADVSAERGGDESTRADT